MKKLVDKSKHTAIQILVGDGMNPETGLKELHFGSAVRINRSFMHPIDEAVITVIKSNLQQLGE